MSPEPASHWRVRVQLTVARVIVARVGPTTPKSIDPKLRRSITPTRARRSFDASVDPTDARNLP
jgi:hypothetical protein